MSKYGGFDHQINHINNSYFPTSDFQTWNSLTCLVFVALERTHPAENGENGVCWFLFLLPSHPNMKMEMWTFWGYEIPWNSHVKITYSWFSTRNSGSTHQLRERWLKSNFLQGFQTPSKRWRTFGISGCHQQYVHLPGENGILHAIFRRKTSGKNKKSPPKTHHLNSCCYFWTKWSLKPVM